MLHFQRKGKGEPLVLLHGFLGTHHIYDRVLAKLERSYDVITVDLPGHGGSPLDPDVHTVYHYAEKIIRLLQSLHINKSTWVGHSFGGYITYAAMKKYRQHLLRAAVVYASPTGDDQKKKENREKNALVIKEEGIDAFAEARIPTYFSEEGHPDDVSFAIKHAKETSEEGAIKALYAMRNRPDVVQLLDIIDIPLLILRGTKDQWDGEFKTNSPSSFVTFADTETSHMGMLDDPDQFLVALEKWLKETSGQS
ncbi:alpha/beta fold hydrolase [Sutcliffiella deserti]|uniref:alpha/beta fold hydrolase n=1 Tax=Sutcliffiella deserti TaxID=2875501 RepID=UPI001CBC0F6B|nr:alpha/beta hydrolase [Sutcliffiella deserti]